MVGACAKNLRQILKITKGKRIYKKWQKEEWHTQNTHVWQRKIMTSIVEKQCILTVCRNTLPKVIKSTFVSVRTNATWNKCVHIIHDYIVLSGTFPSQHRKISFFEHFLPLFFHVPPNAKVLWVQELNFITNIISSQKQKLQRILSHATITSHPWMVKMW